MTLESSIKKLETMRAKGEISRAEFRKRRKDVMRSFGKQVADSAGSSTPSSSKKKKGSSGGGGTTMWVNEEEWGSYPTDGFVGFGTNDLLTASKWEGLTGWAYDVTAVKVVVEPGVSASDWQIRVRGALADGHFYRAGASRTDPVVCKITDDLSLTTLRGNSTMMVSKGDGRKTLNIPFSSGLPRVSPNSTGQALYAGVSLQASGDRDCEFRVGVRFQVKLKNRLGAGGSHL